MPDNEVTRRFEKFFRLSASKALSLTVHSKEPFFVDKAYKAGASNVIENEMKLVGQITTYKLATNVAFVLRKGFNTGYQPLHLFLSIRKSPSFKAGLYFGNIT